MTKTLNTVAAALLAMLGTAHAGIEINGDVTQSVDQKYSPTSALAIGPGASAEASVNTVEGDVKVKGSLNQTAKQAYSPTSALAIGPGATAKARVNAVTSK